MNDEETAKAVAINLKEIVKHTSRQKPVAQYSKERDQVIKIAPKSTSKGSEEDSLAVSVSSSKQDSSSPIHSGASSGSMFSIPPDESDLLMNFLDNVFPLQYPMYQPMYQPGIMNGGRGWLLSMLLLTKPFYHAALTMSAYHRRTITLAKLSQACQVASLVQQEKYLVLSLQSVNEHAQNSCPNSGLGIQISVIQLMFFEV
jgi:hypothetical protein